MKRFLVILSQIIVGLTFIVSGIVKCIDPVGTSIKLHDYFAVLGLSFFDDWTMFFAWCLCLGEFIIGLNVLFGRNRNLFTYLALAVMVVFTPLTLYLAIANPVNDCGCFGDAIVLTNWQTFWKNIVLLSCSVILVLYKDKIYQTTKQDFFTIIFYWELIVAVVLCYLGTNRLPLIDFRPFRPGVNIIEAMGSDDESADVSYVCVYQKDGEKKDFALDNLPDEESGWEFVETKEVSSSGKVVKSKGPEIADFFLFDEFGGDMTEIVLNDPNYTFLLVSPTLANANEKYLDRIENLYEYCMEDGYNFYCVTLNDSVQVNRWKYRTGAEYDFLYSDVTILETVIRSNPGVVLLKEGTILWKSCLNELDIDELTSAKLSEQTYGEIIEDNKKTKVFWLVFLMLAPILLYLPIEKTILYYRKQKSETKNK